MQFLLEEAMVIALEREQGAELAGEQEQSELRAAIERAKAEARRALEGR